MKSTLVAGFLAATFTALPFAALAGGFAGGLPALDTYFNSQDESERRAMERQRFEWERRRTIAAEQERRSQELHRQQVEAQARQAAAEANAAKVQEAIERIPKLKSWQLGDPMRWRRAIEVDNILKALPENQRLSHYDRFQMVVRFVETEDAMRLNDRTTESEVGSVRNR